MGYSFLQIDKLNTVFCQYRLVHCLSCQLICVIATALKFQSIQMLRFYPIDGNVRVSGLCGYVMLINLYFFKVFPPIFSCFGLVLTPDSAARSSAAYTTQRRKIASKRYVLVRHLAINNLTTSNVYDYLLLFIVVCIEQCLF